MPVVLFAPRSGPASLALRAALRAGLGSTTTTTTTAECRLACEQQRPRALVLDLRGAAASETAEAEGVAPGAPELSVLALVNAGRRAPAGSDAVFPEPVFCEDVVRWCWRRLLAPPQQSVLADLAAGLSHEILNPLTVLLLQIDLLRRDETLDGARASLDLMERSGRRIQAVVADVARATERRPVAPSPTRLSAVLDAARAILAARDGALARRLELRVQDRPLAADVPLLATALADLWTWMLLAADDGGPLAVHAGGRDATAVVLSRGRVGPAASEAGARLFTPLWAQRAQQLPDGVSLSAARGAFLRHGGELRAAGLAGGRLVVEALLPEARA